METKNEKLNNNYEKMKCIWMSSQVIEYKLCDNHFDCENCMFDKVMRNLLNNKDAQSSNEVNVVDIIEEKLRSIKYDEKIIYLKNNLIAKEICPNTFYLGIDPILNCFIDASSSLSIYDSEKNISTGQQVIKISGAWGEMNLTSPVNLIVYEKVGNSTDNPLMARWLAIVGLENREFFRDELSLKEWDNKYEKAVGIIEEIKSEVTKVGSTMLDGGTRIKFLHQLLGSKKYIIVLNDLTTQ